MVEGRWNIPCKTSTVLRQMESRTSGGKDGFPVFHNALQVVLGLVERYFQEKTVKGLAISKSLYTFASLNDIKSVLALRHEVISRRFGVGVLVRGEHRNEPPLFCY